jgi:hypothetical protein
VHSKTTFKQTNIINSLMNNLMKGVCKTVMLQFIKAIVEEINKMIVALVEFDYEKAYEEMNKKK